MEVYTVGQNAYGELAQGDNAERHYFTLVESCKSLNVIQVAAGNEHSLILTDSGEVYSSGYNDQIFQASGPPQGALQLQN